MNSKKTFLFIRKNMGIGGIETFLFRKIKALKKNGHRIIWIFPKGGCLDESFYSELLNGKIEMINVNFEDFFWLRKLKLQFDPGEEVFSIAFSLFDFIFLQMIKNQFQNIKMDNFFWVPHFAGKSIFIEEHGSRFLRPILRSLVRRIIMIMEYNNNIIYVNEIHLKALTNRYQYTVKDLRVREKIWGGTGRDYVPYDFELAMLRSKRNNFNIITISRFEFPHKGYLLGLVHAYGKLKEKYDKLQLSIIGYGPDEGKLISEIEKLSDSAQNDIKLIGKVPYDNLPTYFKKAHLNIGVAGAIVDGAITGLISIPVRHYTETCEGYGYLPESRCYEVSNEPGHPIQDYIEEVINMGDETYLELSKKSYDTYIEDNSTETLSKFLSKENEQQGKIPHLYILLIRIGFIIAKKF